MSPGLSQAAALLAALFSVIVWGGSFIATKVAIAEISPATLIWVRFAMGLVVLAATALARRELVPAGRRELLYFALLGFLGVTFHQWLQATGLKTAHASTTGWIVASIPIFMALLGRAFLGETLGMHRWTGIALAALGVMLVIGKGSLSALFSGRSAVAGDYLVLASAPNWAIFSVVSRGGLKRHAAACMMFYVVALGWAFTTPLLLAGPGLGELSALTPRGWIAVLFLGVICSGFAYVFWYDALKRLPAARVGALIYLEPLVAVVVARLVLGEPILPAALAGGALILGGVWLVNRS
jgi:drug/metabolite transporter (DMT)-like permease